MVEEVFYLKLTDKYGFEVATVKVGNTYPNLGEITDKITQFHEAKAAQVERRYELVGHSD